MHVNLIYAARSLFLGALLSDRAYSAYYQVPWKHFAAWLDTGGLVLPGLAFVRGGADARGGVIVADDLSNALWRVTPAQRSAQAR